MVTKFFPPECEFCEEQLDLLLCASEGSGMTEDIGYDDWVIK